jgi:hypothetical protein
LEEAFNAAKVEKTACGMLRRRCDSRCPGMSCAVTQVHAAHILDTAYNHTYKLPSCMHSLAPCSPAKACRNSHGSFAAQRWNCTDMAVFLKCWADKGSCSMPCTSCCEFCGGRHAGY